MEAHPSAWSGWRHSGEGPGRPQGFPGRFPPRSARLPDGGYPRLLNHCAVAFPAPVHHL